MRSITKVIDVDSRLDTFDVYLMADTHLGNRASDEQLIERYVKEIAEKDNALWIGLGDMADAVGRMDPRHREETLAEWCHGVNRVFKLQRDRVVDMFKPIDDKMLSWVMGNHEEYLETRSIDLYYSTLEGIVGDNNEDLALGMSGFLVLKFRRQNGARKGGTSTITFYLHHGFGGGQLMGGKALKLERLPAVYDADIYAMGHTHTKLAFPATRRGVLRNGKLVDKNMLLVNTGGFLSTAIQETTTYSERKGYKAQALGPAIVRLRPGAERQEDRIRVIL